MFRRASTVAPLKGDNAAPRPARRGGAPARFARRFGIGRALGLCLMAALLAVRVWDPAPVEAIRLRTFDFFQMLQPRVPVPDRPVMIVDIDEASIRELGQWPWPRTRVAELIDRLAGLGAVAVGFDIVFAEPDRLSPGLVADAIPNLDAATRDTLRALPSNDEVLAESFGATRVVVGQTAVAQPVPWAGAEPPPQTGFGTLGTGADPFRSFLTLPGLLRNVPVLERAAAGRGFFTIRAEADGIVRRVPMVMRVEDNPVPALTLELLRVLTGTGTIMINTDESGILGVKLPGLSLPTDPNGQIWVHFSPHDPDRFVPARDVLGGRLPADHFANKVVLVGTSAIGLLDNKTTPLDPAMPGVEVHAQLLESALTGTTLITPSYSVVIEMLVAVAVALALVLFAPILGAFTLLVLGAAVAAFLAGASWYRYAHSGILLDATFPLASTFLVYLTLVFTNYFREQLDRVRIRSAFGQYISPALVEQLARSPEKLTLGGEERVLTIMFSDVRGFTAISESYKHDPQGLTALMNRFLTPITNAILARRGTIDKYMGDAVMAFWNAPLDDPDQEANAAAAALDMLDRMRRVNAEREEEAQHGGHAYLPIQIGIGLNTGSCVVGNMGSDLRFDYSVLGDSVNLASRLEGQSKYYGVRIVMGSRTADAIRNRFALLEIDLVTVKGKSEPETISTVVGDEAVRDSAGFADLAGRHADMLASYRARDWSVAAALAREGLERATPYGIGGLYELYLKRVAAFEREPPPQDWRGVYVAESK